MCASISVEHDKSLRFHSCTAMCVAVALLLLAGTHSSCKDEVAAFNSLVAELGGLIKAAAVNVSNVGALSSKGWGLDAPALGSKPCSLQLVLLPFGDSADATDWQLYTGEQHLASSFPVACFGLELAQFGKRTDSAMCASHALMP